MIAPLSGFATAAFPQFWKRPADDAARAAEAGRRLSINEALNLTRAMAVASRGR